MLRVVPDTNVLVSAALVERGDEYKLLRLAKLGDIQLVLSYDILWELEEVLNRPKFSFSKPQIKAYLELLKKISEIVEIGNKLKIVKDDPDDDKIVETAVVGKADYLISGDKHLLNLGDSFRGIKIMNAKGFLEKLSK